MTETRVPLHEARRPFLRVPAAHALLAALLVAAAGLALAPAGAAAEDAGRARLHAFLDDVATFRGAFRQEVRDGSGRLVEESAGQVVMQRPGRFRWNYEQPFERVIVADGERVWLYEADLDQVTVRRLGDGLGDTPAALLTGRENVLERFRVERSWREGALLKVALTPLSTDADFSTVTLGFDGDRLILLELDDRLGQHTRVEFSDVVLNPPVGADTFTFEVPPGVDVIDDADL